MKVKQILTFLICPSCQSKKLRLKDRKIFCVDCKQSYDVVNEIPIMIINKKLSRQEMQQQKIFDTHYSYFSEKKLRLENWRLSMLKRIFENNFCSGVKTYLDIGCGATGYTTIEAAKRNNWQAFGVDISLQAMMTAQKIAEKNDVCEKTAFIVCSAENLPFRKSSFDYISAVSVLEHLDDDDKAIENIHKILKNNGYFYVCVPNSYKNIWLFLWPIYFYFDYKVGHKKHYSSKSIINKMRKNKLFKLEKIYYNGHLIKLWQLLLEKLNLIDDKRWWLFEKKDINKKPSGMQLNAIFKKNKS